jgi:hypothetical protein
MGGDRGKGLCGVDGLAPARPKQCAVAASLLGAASQIAFSSPANRIPPCYNCNSSAGITALRYASPRT